MRTLVVALIGVVAFASGVMLGFELDADVETSSPAAGLPAPVEATRAALLEAADAGDYDALAELSDSPVVALNRAVAIGMLKGPARGIAEIERIRERGAMRDHVHAHAALGKFHEALGDRERAAACYEAAVRAASSSATRAFLEAKIERLRSG